MKTRPNLSIIVPSFNDGVYLRQRVPALLSDPHWEVIVVEAGTKKYHLPKACRRIHSRRANRAHQMNLGAAQARGEILLFLHADTEIEVASLPALIKSLARQRRYVGGCYQFALDHPDWRARMMEFGVLLREIFFRLPYGDQALFVRKQIFDQLGGYPQVPVLEDVLFVEALRQQGRLLYFEYTAKTSARKWKQQGFFNTMWANWRTMLKYQAGASLSELQRYRKKIFFHA